ncbi:ArsR family transcriptional regulator [Paenibacillus sp. FSL E2-0178]|uniref:ArsR family transcriptional regulator n=1 Tax=Paenibacillus sp. FSL E2-0178 TaxID=2921361 RepID=UPI003158297C
MEDQLLEAVLNPTKIRIIEVLSDGRKSTQYELMEKLDIPKSTLYRHSKTLFDLGILRVSDTVRKGGAIENVIYLADDEDLKERTKGTMEFIKHISRLIGEHNRKYADNNE